MYGKVMKVFDVESYMTRLIVALHEQFGVRLMYVGLQGSYLRGEANDRSDIDVMVVIEGLGVRDLGIYRDVILAFERPDQSCGFICSKTDLANWNSLEMCHLLHSTRDYYGTLRQFVPSYTENDVRNFIRMSVNNLYHAICHRYIHAGRDKSAERLPTAYKEVFFILQNLCYVERGEFAQTKAQLLTLLSGKDKLVLERAIAFDSNAEFNFDESFELLFSWCQETLPRV
ncbi:MAG: nucleotidyltransferase domain-containing protein [Clostridia bacterium]|nr:nucleotidyltransferase domain-containing protein [Clostridia bacterium]